jgi:dethiobiotin synthetase/adenosylmethionine--8-amino-7-oxononanoate aminotransferase
VEEDRERLGKWYEEVEATSEGGVAGTVEWLEREHEERIKSLDGMAERTLESVWWPFTQHGLVSIFVDCQARS